MERATSEHLQQVRQREASLYSPSGMQNLQDRARGVLAPAQADRQRLLHEAWKAPSRAKAVVWLRKAADRLGLAISTEVACRRGCSACCHQDVLVTEAEAALIGRAIGRPPEPQPPAARLVGTDPDALPVDEPPRFSGQPCTFLHHGECAIFSERPIVCRLQASFDQDDLLCQIVPGEAISVPYVDVTVEKAVMSARLALGSRVADIRDWFPPQTQDHGASHD